MDFLLEISMFRSTVDWVWGEEAEMCVKGLPLMPLDCWTGLAVKGLGVAIILGSFLNKAPIMVNLYKAKSVEGLSRSSTYCDALVLANSASYGFLQGFPVTAYGENLALLVQTVILVFMIWHYTKKPGVSVVEQAAVALATVAYVIGVVYTLPKEKTYYLMASVWPIYIFAKGTQIVETFRTKHTGAQSVVTITTSLVGCIIRILTTLREVGMDFAVLTGYLLGVVLNGTMLAQYIVYKENTEKFLRELKKQD